MCHDASRQTDLDALSSSSSSIDIKDMCTENGEELVFRELDQRFPDKVAPYGRSHEEALRLKIMKDETTEASLDGEDLYLPVLSRTVRTCRWMPGATLSCVDVDCGVWVEQRSCLRHGETVSLMRCAWRSGRRFLVVHGIGILMGLSCGGVG